MIQCIKWALWAPLIPLLLSCHPHAAPPASPDSQPAHSITLLHTNDIHGGFIARESTHSNSGEKTGGFEALDSALSTFKKGNSPFLLLDSGDLLTGSPATTLLYKDVPGGGMFEMFNILEYDVWTLGNHEFDGSRAALQGGISLLEMPTLCANLTTDTGLPVIEGVQPYIVVERGGLKIAIAGLMTGSLNQVLPLENLEGLALASPNAMAQELIEEMDEKSDLIVFLTHQGVEDDRRLAESVQGIDVIVGGHSHTLLKEPLKVNDTLIVQAGSDLFHLGRLDLTVKDDHVIHYKGQVIPLIPNAQAAPPSGEIIALVETLENGVEALYGQVVGNIVSPLTRAHHAESNMGNWLADTLRKQTKTQIALINSGGIRTDLNPGPLSLRQLKSCMPFDNLVTTFTLTGEELEALALHNAEASIHKNHGILQISGFSYTFQQSSKGIEITELKVGGEPIISEGLYSVASSDFVVFSQAEQYFGFEPSNRQKGVLTLFDALADGLGSDAQIDVVLDQRMREISTHEP